jgi:hypothetical protein
MAGAGALVMLGLVAPAHAAGTTVTVFDASSDEANWRCTASAPYGCSIRQGSLQFMIRMSPAPKQSVTLGWRVEDITATAGQDYSGPTSGTINYAANSNQAYLYIPVLRDSVTEPNETLRLRITSSSVPADLTDTGIGTIRDGLGGIPTDCTVTQTTFNNMFMTCTNRPPAQHWHLRAFCANIGGGDFWDGNIVTGNGTSSVTWCGGYAYYPYFIVDP